MSDNFWKFGCKSEIAGCLFRPIFDCENVGHSIKGRIYFYKIKNRRIKLEPTRI
jgi:hypothetical protein